MGNGYTIQRGQVPDSDLTKIWMNIHLLVAKQLERLNIKPTADMQKNLVALLTADAELYIATLSLASRLKSVFDMFGKIVNDEVVLAVPSFPVLHVMANDLKIPDGYHGTLAHQDWASTQGSLDTMTLWVPITNTVGNFPLEIAPKTHHKPLLPGKTNGSVVEVDYDGPFATLDAEFGDVVCFTGFAVHRTGKGGNGLRMAVSMRYERVDEKTFIERGYPCAQKRVVDREIRFNPTEEQIREAFYAVD
jgi:hypothetical protein